MLSDPDNSLKVLSAIYTEFGDFCQKRGIVNEADTRAKIIDRILKEVLCWPERAITREQSVERGYVDYILSSETKKLVVVEAKREGLPFDVPKTLQTRKKYKISGSIKTNVVLKEAIEQALYYCVEKAIRYAVITNGYAWLIYRAMREDKPWREGEVLVFPSAKYIKENFNDFWNLLSYPAVIEGSLNRIFTSEITTPRLLYRPLNLLRNPDALLHRNRLHMQLHPFVDGIFRDIGAKEQLEILESCYVYNKSLRIIDEDINLIIEDSIPKFIKTEGAVETKPGPRDSGAMGEEIKEAVRKQKGGTILLLLGGIGSGKTTFLNRFFRYIGNIFLDKYALCYYIDFLVSPPNLSELELFLKKSILQQLRDSYSH